jgi:hypothetical protein
LRFPPASFLFLRAFPLWRGWKFHPARGQRAPFKTAPLDSKKGCLYSMFRLRHLPRHPTVSNATSHSLVSPMLLLLHPTAAKSWKGTRNRP